MLSFFKRGRSTIPSRATDGRDGLGRDPFTAIPVRNTLVESREDSHGLLQLRMRLPAAAGVASRLAARFGCHRDVRINLDERGSFFWSTIDGRRELGMIEELLRVRFALGREESRKATILFTRMLMMRRLILLDVHPDRKRREPHHA